MFNYDNADTFGDGHCQEYYKCDNCFQINKKKCAKLNQWNPRNKQFILSFMLTDECNQNCQYCWQKQGCPTYGTFTEENLEKIIDYFYKNYNEYSLVFGILGGEPTLYPNLLGKLAEKSYQLYDKLSMRVYTNGKFEKKDELLDICDKYENITFQVSDNYDIINYKHFNKYCIASSVVFYEECKIEDTIVLLKQIKQLGYKETVINFDLRRTPLKNPLKYYQTMCQLLEQCASLADDSFLINNFIYNDYGIRSIEDFTPSINIFPDCKFYLTHYIKSTPIGDLNTLIDIKQLYEPVKNSLCNNCANHDICTTDINWPFLNADLSQTKNTNICLNCLAMNEVTRKLKLDRRGKPIPIEKQGKFERVGYF